LTNLRQEPSRSR